MTTGDLRSSKETINRRRRLLAGLPLACAAGGLCAGLLPAAALAASADGLPPIRLALIESLSGPFANTGEAVFRNLTFATERINARGGVRLPQGNRRLQIVRYDSKGQNEEALAALRAAVDDGVQFIAQGNSSATASVLVDALEKHNRREPQKRVLYLNYSAVAPELTNERCSFWHFRFDAHADMRMAALMSVIREDRALQAVYLIGQDYSFGQHVLRQAQAQLQQLRPDVRIVGNELHPLGRVKDFAPYAAKIMKSGASAIITANWGNDLTLLIRAARDAGFDGMFYTFYGNALGAPAALGDAGAGRVVAVADWMPNVPDERSAAFYRAFRQRFPDPADDYVHMRMQLLVEALAQSLERAGDADPLKVAQAMESADVELAGRRGTMRAADHQFQQPLVVGLMQRQGAPGVPFDVEGSGYGFRILKDIPAAEAAMPTTCRMNRPG